MAHTIPSLASMIEYDTGRDPISEEVFRYRTAECSRCDKRRRVAQVSFDGGLFEDVCRSCYHMETWQPVDEDRPLGR